MAHGNCHIQLLALKLFPPFYAQPKRRLIVTPLFLPRRCGTRSAIAALRVAVLAVPEWRPAAHPARQVAPTYHPSHQISRSTRLKRAGWPIRSNTVPCTSRVASSDAPFSRQPRVSLKEPRCSGVKVLENNPHSSPRGSSRTLSVLPSGATIFRTTVSLLQRFPPHSSDIGIEGNTVPHLRPIRGVIQTHQFTSRHAALGRPSNEQPVPRIDSGICLPPLRATARHHRCP